MKSGPLQETIEALSQAQANDPNGYYESLKHMRAQSLREIYVNLEPHQTELIQDIKLRIDKFDAESRLEEITLELMKLNNTAVFFPNKRDEVESQKEPFQAERNCVEQKVKIFNKVMEIDDDIGFARATVLEGRLSTETSAKFENRVDMLRGEQKKLSEKIQGLDAQIQHIKSTETAKKESTDSLFHTPAVTYAKSIHGKPKATDEQSMDSKKRDVIKPH